MVRSREDLEQLVVALVAFAVVVSGGFDADAMPAFQTMGVDQ